MKFDQNSNILIQENAFESFVCEMAAILSRPQCVKHDLIFSTQMFQSKTEQFKDSLRKTKQLKLI